MSNNPTVLVIGGGGYIGSHLTRMLVKNKFPTRVYDSFQFGESGVSDISSKYLSVIHGDICDSRAIAKAVSGSDIVVMLAAIVGHRLRESKKEGMREVNLLSSSLVLDAASEYGCQRLICASTD